MANMLSRGLSGGLSGGQRALFLLAAAGVLFVSLNVVAEKLIVGARLDLTEDKLFTLSDGTHEILADLSEPVTLEYYFSEQSAVPYPQLLRYGNRVRDLLIEIERASDGKIDLRLRNPEPFSEAEDEAVGAGLQAVPTAGGDSLFLGLVATDTTDQRTVMPFLSTDREAFLEYDIVKTIYALSQSAKPRLALLSSLPLQYGPGGIMAYLQGQGQPYVIYQQLSQFFEIVMLDPSFEAMPEDVEAFLIVHPPALEMAQLYAIDQYVLGGGRALIFVDPFAEESAVAASRSSASMAAGGLPPQAIPESSSVGPLFAAWGLDYDSGVVVGDLEIAQRVNVGGARAIRDYVIWLSISEDNLNSDDVVSGAVNSMNLATVGSLVARDNATTTLTPLVSSSVVSSLIPVDVVRDQPDPDDLIRDMIPDDVIHTLIGRVTGPARSAFPDGPPEGVSGESPHLSESSESNGGINIVVGADGDMFTDRFWVQIQNYLGQSVATPIADNGAFIVSAVDHMIGSDALISLRSRRVSQRPFHAVDKIRRAAEARFLDEEQRLQDKLAATEQRIADMQSAQETGTDLLSLEQEAEIDRFREDMLATRKQLREVQRNLRQEIDALGTWVTVINVTGVPLILVLAWLGVMTRRSWYRG